MHAGFIPWGSIPYYPMANTSVDLDAHPRIRNDRVDMGAYEFQETTIDSTHGLPVSIPTEWLYRYRGWQGVMGYVDLAVMQGANGMPLWQSYVAGCNPTDKDSKFVTFIEMDGNDAPIISWTPDLGSNRVYVVEGKTNLTDATWHSLTNNGTRFFRVKIGVP